MRIIIDEQLYLGRVVVDKEILTVNQMSVQHLLVVSCVLVRVVQIDECK